MRVSRLVESFVRWLAGPGDAESLLADLECELDERERRDGAAAARRWLRREVARSAPTLAARRLAHSTRSLIGELPMFHRGVWLDVQHVWRRLRRSPGFATLAVVMLGIGLGAVTSVFSLAYTIWLKPLPYHAPETLVSVSSTQTRVGLRSGSSGPEIGDIREGISSFSGVAGYHYGAIFARFGDEAVRLESDPVTANLFAVLGVAPQLGRPFGPEDEGQPVVMLSDALWRSRFQRDPGVIGRTIGGLAERMTVVGVMPPEFRFPLGLEADCWTPTLRTTGDRARRLTQIVARLSTGATIDRANAELAALSDRLGAAYPASNEGWTLMAGPLAGLPSPAYRAAFTTLLAMVGLFLLIACANLASLLVARNLARRNELTVMLATGAPPWRLARAVLIESAMLSAAGSALALALAAGATQAFARWMPPATPRLGDLRVDLVVFVFAMAVAACTAALCAVAPIAGVRSLRLADSLSGVRTVGAGSNRGEHALVIVEIALAAVLLMGGIAMVRSFNELLDRDRGYVPAGVIAMTVALAFDQPRYEAAPVRSLAFDEILASIARVPGVAAVGGATGFPGSSLGILGGGPVTVPGRTDPPVIAALHNATPDYFRAMGVTVKRGRVFTSADTAASQRVVVINETLEHQLFPHGDSLGQRFTIPVAIGLTDGGAGQAEVVGVVADMHLGARRTADIFVPFAQVPSFWADVVVRTSGDPASLAEPIRQAIGRGRPDVLVEHVSPLQTIISDVFGLQRAQSFLTALVAALGGVLALMGLYALLNQHVARRTREMGVRLALGSSPQRLFWSVFRRGMRLSMIGTAAGLVVALAAVRLLRGQVFGLDLVAAHVFLLVAAGIAAASALVIATSARRVVSIDPIASIRQG